jgi:2-methylisocitrate lyase-like PEP mutase family enzyme
MSPDIADKRRAFAALHQSGCFVIPNPWDAGSARYLQSLGFKALATTSAGFAWSHARPDNGITRDIGAGPSARDGGGGGCAHQCGF